MKISIIDFSKPSQLVAPQLIGCEFYINGVGGLIVEVEAYDQTEAASHSFAGKTLRNQSMFGPPACAYVYRSYGIHWCLNFVCGPEDHGAGVLIRAIQPLAGKELMRERRGIEEEKLWCAGPGRLAQALGVTHDMNGMPLHKTPFDLRTPKNKPELIAGPRIGISKAIELPWRFGLSNSRYLSKPFR
jgi:DNA-3-methyladenine glycosylase